ncbi:triose-phosphate isomerase [Candidatus Albibeggiatoa sp. nov. NOAA]|uniref:triose-phosphate isomerase n=1 Tax=Candidatus Albibeggiatoa sp. nov. NOAA TaxID=3162724 RepID=UPI0032FE7281|nr:triose-phosphate isomerase [Thiotrichaceae bacterium]
MRQPLIAGNWKMNGSKASIESLLEGIKQGMDSVQQAEVAVCAPFVYLQQVSESLKDTKIAYGAQNVSEQDNGAYTGEVSTTMLNDFACQYVIVGHSERRTLYGETDELVATKSAKAQADGLTPIICIGELLEEREAGNTEAVVARQLDAVINANGVASLENAVIAYEPVWAIGTGKTATPEQAQAVHAFIRGRIAEQDAAIADKVRILYGGSMKPANAEELVAQQDIDGGLIGGASLKAEDFLAICQAAK